MSGPLTGQQTQQFACVSCGTSFANQEKLDVHNRQNHAGNIRRR